jgi:hypothetical protein
VSGAAGRSVRGVQFSSCHNPWSVYSSTSFTCHSQQCSAVEDVTHQGVWVWVLVRLGQCCTRQRPAHPAVSCSPTSLGAHCCCGHTTAEDAAGAVVPRLRVSLHFTDCWLGCLCTTVHQMLFCAAQGGGVVGWVYDHMPGLPHSPVGRPPAAGKLKQGERHAIGRQGVLHWGAGSTGRAGVAGSLVLLNGSVKQITRTSTPLEPLSPQFPQPLQCELRYLE